VNPEPRSQGEAQWAIAPEPKVTIGAVEGRAEYQLYDVSGAVLLCDSVLVIANRGTHELRFYDGQGRYLRTAGGEGDGPAEFRALDFVDRYAGDSLLAFDGRQLRASVFDQEGHFARSFSIGRPTDSGFPDLIGVLSSGSIVVRVNHPYVAGVARTGFDRSAAQVFVSGPDGEARDTLGSFPGLETFVMALPDEMWMSVRPVRFGRGLVTAVSDERIALAETDTFEIRLYGEDGVPREIVRQRRLPVPVTAEEVNRFNEAKLAEVDDERSRQHYREMYDLMPQHETFPALASIRLDRAGNLWVKEFVRPGATAAIWQVFDGEGRITAQLTLPADFELLDIGGDYVIGLTRDELGIERVLWYNLDEVES
jgi:hypothetical protein